MEKLEVPRMLKSPRLMSLLMILWVIGAAAIVVLLIYGFFSRFFGDSDSEPVRARDVAIVATPAPQIVQADVEFIALPQPVKTYAPKAKKALKLPAAVAADDGQRVLDAARIAASDRPQTVTAVLDTATGETRTYVVEEPLPWLDTTPRGEAGLYFGIKRGEPTIRAQARAQIAQVKELRLGVLASADMPLNAGAAGAQFDHFVGVGGWMQW